MSELDSIKERYSKRDRDPGASRNRSAVVYGSYISREREKVYEREIRTHFGDEVDQLKVLEIGAGHGGNISFFKQLGIPGNRIWANELLEHRIAALRSRHPDINIIPGDALDIGGLAEFDIVFQSTVFTSILDKEFRIRLAMKMFDLVKEGGMVLWYDFVYDNPSNPDVRKVAKDEIIRLFPAARDFRFFNVTLAPPVGRLVRDLYPLFNIFTFLRTHAVGVILK